MSFQGTSFFALCACALFACGGSINTVEAADSAPPDSDPPPTEVFPDAGPPDNGDAVAVNGREIIASDVLADSIVVDAESVYWRSSVLDSTQTYYSVSLAKCPLDGGCPAGGTVLGSTSTILVMSGSEQIALAAGKVIAPVGGDLLACETGGCGGTLSTIASTPGTITSVTVSGSQLYFGETGEVGSRFIESCDVTSCAHPTQLGATTGAPEEPSLAGNVLAFAAGGIYVTPATGFSSGGATLLASLNGGIGGGIWNDGTDVYFAVAGVVATDDAGTDYLRNDTGYVARCAVTGCGGSPTMVASYESNVGNLIIDGTDVYWAVGGTQDDNGVLTGPGAIETCSTVDRCTTIHELVTGGSPTNLTVDATYVYWADWSSKTISKTPRR